jgi:hypothetical protein
MKRKLMYLMTAVSLFSVSCEKDDKEDPNEEELITTVRVSLVEQGTTTPQVFTFRDVDGPGGVAPTLFDSIRINANKTYAASIQFLNESVTPAEDITAEVIAEADEHQIYFEPTGVSLVASNLNNDGRGLPLGVTSTWTAGGVGIGKMKVTLKHKPGTKAANDPVTKGETDVEVEFGVRLR